MDEKKLKTMIESVLELKLDPIAKTLEEVKLKISKLNDIEKAITFLSNRYDEIFEKVKKLEHDNGLLQQECKSVSMELHQSTNSITQLKQEVNNLEQYSRRDCLEMRGIPATDDEDTDELVKQVGKLMDVQIVDEDISTSHRLPLPSYVRTNRNAKSRDPVIIVKFVRRDIRDRFYKSKHNLRNKSTRDLGMVRMEERKIFITESLTQQNRKLFNRCQQAKRDLDFKFIWTKNGKILMRKDTDSPALSITNEWELQRLLDDFDS